MKIVEIDLGTFDVTFSLWPSVYSKRLLVSHLSFHPVKRKYLCTLF